MFSFMLKIWGLARPYRGRLYLGILTGLISGFMEPLMIATITFVYGLIFPSAASGAGTDKLSMVEHLPGFVLNWLHAAQHWLESVQLALASGVQEHQAAVIGLIALIPAVVFLRGVFSYLNIYLLQWVAIRAITDLRVRLFEHLMNLSAGFFTTANSGDLISRMTNDTNTLQGIISNATAVIIKEPATLFFTFCLLMLTSPGLTLLSLVVLPLCVIPIAVYGRKVRRSAGNMQDHYSELHQRHVRVLHRQPHHQGVQPGGHRDRAVPRHRGQIDRPLHAHRSRHGDPRPAHGSLRRRRRGPRHLLPGPPLAGPR